MKRMMIAIVAILLVLGIVISICLDIRKNRLFERIPDRPAMAPQSRVDSILWKLENDIPFNSAEFDGDFQYINGRYDCSDFRLQSLLCILYKYEDKQDQETKDKIKATLIGFKYWMDEHGEDSMVFWSENHQVLFAAAEYLAGMKYPDDIFTNSNMTGKQHMQKARKRIMTWMEQRWKYGFTEWYSNVYYVEDIAPMSNIIEFSGDSELSAKMSIIMDLLLYDIASQSYKGTFVTTSGRAYEASKKSGAVANTRAITEAVFGYDTDPFEHRGMVLNFIYNDQYEVPQVIKAIGQNENEVVVKASNGLDVSELKDEILIGGEDYQIMMQWAMEAFTNKEVITNTMNYIRKHNMFNHAFLHAFKDINYTLLVKLRLLPLVSRIVNPQTNGIAIQRANTYTYKTPYYSMATTQSYHPGDYGDQHQVSISTFSNELSIFNNHPAVGKGERGPNGRSSPLYWVGYGHLPHSVQEKNINLSLYVLPDKKGLMEKELLHYTHEYFPKRKFEEVVLKGNYAFAKHQDAYVALIGRNEITYAVGTTDDLLQQGQETFWITEMGSADKDGTFEDFMKRIKGNKVEYESQTLIYVSNGNEYRLEFGKNFTIDGDVVDTNYKRISSPYAEVERKPDSMTFEFAGHSLFLDFENGIRKFN